MPRAACADYIDSLERTRRDVPSDAHPRLPGCAVRGARSRPAGQAASLSPLTRSSSTIRFRCAARARQDMSRLTQAPARNASRHPQDIRRTRQELQMNVFWFIPTHGDSRYLGTSQGARAADYDYFRQIAVAADTLGYEGVLLPTGRSCEDAWVVASSLIPATKRLKFLVAIRPGISSPGLSARMASTFDRLSGGRLLINVVTGGDAAELEGDGLFVDHDTRYEITDEFLRIWRGLLSSAHQGESFDFVGKHLTSKGGKVLYPPVQDPHPPLWFGG